MNKKLEKYILEHSTSEDPVLEDLYRQTHIRFVNPNMVTGHMQGKLLEFISRMIRPEMILEIGTFTGYSAICLARGLRQKGKLITIELNDEMSGFSRSYFDRAGVASKVLQMNGRAQDLIEELDYKFDLVFIDGDKREYVEYYNAVFKKVRQGGYILADNVLWGGNVLDTNSRDPQTMGIIEFNEMIMKQPDIEKIILPVRDGLMIIRKL